MSTKKIASSEVAQIAAQLLALQRQVFDAGMPKTGGAIGLAVRHLGWEAARSSPFIEPAERRPRSSITKAGLADTTGGAV